MTDTTQPTSNNKSFYMAIAGSIIGLFLLLFVPCIVAMCVARVREKRQERRDALARELEEGEDECDGDDVMYGPFLEDVYHIEELGESSGWREPQQDTQELDSATQLISQEEEEDTSIQQHNVFEEIREPQYDGKGKAPMYPQVQSVLVEQLPEHHQVKPAGRFQEHLPEVSASAQRQDEQEAVEEFQDAQEAAPVQQQLAAKKQEEA
ncbi:hypothetical protein ACHAQJ_010732 [Trichoderma viride]